VHVSAGVWVCGVGTRSDVLSGWDRSRVAEVAIEKLVIRILERSYRGLTMKPYRKVSAVGWVRS
jgi:hypothetical protein